MAVLHNPVLFYHEPHQDYVSSTQSSLHGDTHIPTQVYPLVTPQSGLQQRTYHLMHVACALHVLLYSNNSSSSGSSSTPLTQGPAARQSPNGMESTQVNGATSSLVSPGVVVGYWSRAKMPTTTREKKYYTLSLPGLGHAHRLRTSIRCCTILVSGFYWTNRITRPPSF